MSHREPPRFPRGFLLSERPTNRPPTFIEGPILPNFYIHPWNRVETSGDSRLFVIIIGNCVPTEPIQLGSVADSLLARLQDSETEFLRALAIYSGRHVIIFGSYGDIRVVNDATSMRSVFYATSGGVIASHRSEEHTSELQSRGHLVCRLLLEKKNKVANRFMV